MTESTTGSNMRATAPTEHGLKGFARRHGQMLMNVYLFVNIALWVAWRIHKTWLAGDMGYVEIAFAIQNLIFLAFILARRAHQAVDRNPFHQLVAIGAFFLRYRFIPFVF